MGVVMPVTLSVLTPGLLAVKDPGVKPPATITCAAVADLTSTVPRADAGSLQAHSTLNVASRKVQLAGPLNFYC